MYKRQGQEDHRVLSVVGKIGFSAGPDFLISEVNGSVLGRLFEESAEHIHVKRLAKASGDVYKRQTGIVLFQIG